MHAPAFSLSPPTPLAERELKTQIQQALSNRITGQIDVSFLNGRSETIFAYQGVVQLAYIRNHRLPDTKWEEPLIRFGRGTLTIESLLPRAMLFRKIALEVITPVKPQRSGTNQLMTMFSLAERNTNPTLFHIKWERAEGFVLVAGKGIPIRHAVLLTNAGAEEAAVALNQIPAWEEPQCDVTVFRGDIMNQAWLEIHLNLLLEWMCHNALSRYGHLTGNVVVRSILHNIVVLAARKVWVISIENQQVQDATLFPTAAATGAAYREIFSSIKKQMEPIIGSALTRDLWKQSRETLRDVYRITEEAFGLTEETA